MTGYTSLYGQHFRRTATAVAFAAMAALPLVAAPALAQDTTTPAPSGQRAVQIDSLIQVERSTQNADGSVSTDLVKPIDVTVVPGDKLLFTLTYKNASAAPAANFVAVNPVNPAVAFTGAGEDWAEVSVDGGKTWGKLSDLNVAGVADAAAAATDNADTAAPQTAPVAPRAARAEDVTHIRWKFADPIPAGATGKLTFRGVVK